MEIIDREDLHLDRPGRPGASPKVPHTPQAAIVAATRIILIFILPTRQ